MPIRPPKFVDDRLKGESPTAANLDAMSLAMPMTMLRNASAKPLTEMLGEILTPNVKGSGLPARMRLTGYSPLEQTVSLHGVGNGQPIESSIQEFQRLHDAGAIMREGPSTEGLSVAALVKRLRAMLPK